MFFFHCLSGKRQNPGFVFWTKVLWNLLHFSSRLLYEYAESNNTRENCQSFTRHKSSIWVSAENAESNHSDFWNYPPMLEYCPESLALLKAYFVCRPCRAPCCLYRQRHSDVENHWKAEERNLEKKVGNVTGIFKEKRNKKTRNNDGGKWQDLFLKVCCCWWCLFVCKIVEICGHSLTKWCSVFFVP